MLTIIAFIKTAYCVTIPVMVLLARLSDAGRKKIIINIIAVSNLLLIAHSVFLLKQMAGAYQLAKTYSINYRQFLGGTSLAICIGLIIFLPVLSLSPAFRRNQLFSIFLVGLLYSVYPYSSWNNYDLVFKIAAYLCLMCSGYALLWLVNKLPYQSREL